MHDASQHDITHMRFFEVKRNRVLRQRAQPHTLFILYCLAGLHI